MINNVKNTINRLWAAKRLFKSELIIRSGQEAIKTTKKAMFEYFGHYMAKRIVTLLNLYALYKKLLCMYVCMYVIEMPLKSWKINFLL